METVDVETEVNKVIEVAGDQLRDELVDLGHEIDRQEIAFWEAEKRFSQAIIAFACRMMRLLFQLYDHGAKYVTYEGEIWRRGTEKKTASYSTIWGEVQVDRWVYLKRGKSGGEQLVPMETKAGLIDGNWTPQCGEAISRMVQSAPSREAVDNMKAVGLLPYSRSSFDRVAETMGETWEKHREELEDEVIEAVEIPEEAEGISVAFDRVRIEMDETERDDEQWPNGRKQPRDINGRMAYCATVTLHDIDGEPLWTKRYGRVSDQPPDQDVPGVGEWLIREQVKWDVECLLDRARRLKAHRVVLTDGGPELERIVDEDYPDWPKLCDLRHLSSYLADALEGIGLDAEQRQAQHRRWLHHLKRDDDTLEKIEAMLSHYEGRHEAVDDALTYIDNRRGRMSYASAHADNLPIASGHVEATCKSLVEVRMRRSGQRWTKGTAQSVLNLRSLALSDIWSTGMAKLMETFGNDDNITRCDDLCDRHAA